jgi:hypothetical protein
MTTCVQYVERSYRRTLPNSAALEQCHVGMRAKRLDSVEADDAWQRSRFFQKGRVSDNYSYHIFSKCHNLFGGFSDTQSLMAWKRGNVMALQVLNLMKWKHGVDFWHIVLANV